MSSSPSSKPSTVHAPTVSGPDAKRSRSASGGERSCDFLAQQPLIVRRQSVTRVPTCGSPNGRGICRSRRAGRPSSRITDPAAGADQAFNTWNEAMHLRGNRQETRSTNNSMEGNHGVSIEEATVLVTGGHGASERRSSTRSWPLAPAGSTPPRGIRQRATTHGSSPGCSTSTIRRRSRASPTSQVRSRSS